MESAGSRVCTDKEPEAAILIGLGQQGRKTASDGGRKKKSHFSSESSKFSYSPGSSSLPPQPSFPAGLTSRRPPSTHAFSGFAFSSFSANVTLRTAEVQGDSGSRILHHGRTDTGNSPCSGWERMLPHRWASPPLSLSHCTQPMLRLLLLPLHLVHAQALQSMVLARSAANLQPGWPE